MAATRPLVSVISDKGETAGQVTLPAVFTAPIRPDVVSFVHTNMAKNSRQAYGVSRDASMRTTAESWGTGRAVSRIPRVGGSGTGRSGQGAYGNMCRGGRMFAPNRVWRRWHRKINVSTKRFAVVSAIAATALPSLVMGRGHHISNVPEIPLVLDDSVESVLKTANAVKVLKAVGAYEDVEHVKDSKAIRAGKGKMRNRRYVQRRGPLVVYNKDDGIVKAFRNLPGVELAHVERLNLLQLAPGGHLGRFCIWTKGAFERLDAVYGTFTEESQLKKGFKLPAPTMTLPDVARLINSDEIQSAVRPAISNPVRVQRQKKNPLRNLYVMLRLNPYAKQVRRAEITKASRTKADRKAVLSPAKVAASKKQRAAHKKAQKNFYNSMFDFSVNPTIVTEHHDARDWIAQ